MSVSLRKVVASLCCLVLCLSNSLVAVTASVVAPGFQPEQTNGDSGEQEYITNYFASTPLDSHDCEFKDYLSDYSSSSKNFRSQQFRRVSRLSTVSSSVPNDPSVENTSCVHVSFPEFYRSNQRKDVKALQPRTLKIAETEHEGGAVGLKAENNSKKAVKQELPVRRSYPVWSQHMPLSGEPFQTFVLKFSEPMVSQDIVGKWATVKEVSISPQTDGRWQWLNASTLAFTANSSFLPGTTYDITVQSGTKSVHGNTLTKSFITSFSTAMERLGCSVLDDSGAILLDFKQPVNPEDVLSHLKVALRDDQPRKEGNTTSPASFGRVVAVRLANDSEAQKLTGEKFRKNYTIVVLPDAKPPVGSMVDISITSGIRSLNSRSEFTEPFSSTYRILGDAIRPKNQTIASPEPNQSFDIHFDRPLGEKNKTDLVSVTPPIPNLRIYKQYASLMLQGKTKPDTVYSVTIKKGFAGADGSRLSEDKTLSVKVKSYLPRLIPPAHPFQILRKNEKCFLPIQSINVRKIRVRLYDATELGRGWTRLDFISPYGEKAPLQDTTLSGNGLTNKIAETGIDLTRFARSGPRQLNVLVEQVENQDSPASNSEKDAAKPDFYCQNHFPIKSYWVALQISNLAVTSFSTGNKISFLVVDAFSGQPISHAAVKCQSPDGLDGGGDWYRQHTDAQKDTYYTDANGLCLVPSVAVAPGGTSFSASTADDCGVTFADTHSRDEDKVEVLSLLTEDTARSGGVKISLPFDKSHGVLVSKTNGAFTVAPVAFSSNTAFLPAQSKGSTLDLKVYETKSDTKHPSRTAIVSLYTDASGTHIGGGLRRSALPIDVELNGHQKPNVHGAAMSFLRDPYSSDSLPTPQSCPLINLEWQTSARWAGTSSSHSAKNSRLDEFPLHNAAKIHYPDRSDAPIANVDDVTVSVKPSPTAANSEVTAEIPSFVYSGDEVHLPIAIKNRSGKNLNVLVVAEKGRVDFSSTNVEIEAGKTDLVLDHYEKLLAQKEPEQPVALRIELRDPETSKQISSFRFECSTDIKPRDNQLLWNGGVSASGFKKTITLSASPSNPRYWISNESDSLLNVYEYLITERPIKTILQRATRLRAFCERRRWAVLSKSPDAYKFDKVIESDIKLLRKSLHHDPRWMSWFPEGDNISGSHEGRLEVTPYLVVDAVQTAQAAGFKGCEYFDWNELSDLLLAKAKDVPRWSEIERLQCYGIYLVARAHKLAPAKEREAYFFKQCQSEFNKLFSNHRIDELSDESLVYLTMASRILPVETRVKDLLEARVQDVLARISDKSENLSLTEIERDSKSVTKMIEGVCHGNSRNSYVYDKIEFDSSSIFNSATVSSLLLETALTVNGKDRARTDVQSCGKVASIIEGIAYGGCWNDTTAGICMSALYRHRALGRRSPVTGSFMISESSSAGPAESKSFSYSEKTPSTVSGILPSFKPVPSQSQFLITPGLRYQVLASGSSSLTGQESIDNEIYSMTREFLVAKKSYDVHGNEILHTEQSDTGDSAGKVWRDNDGFWHCKRNTPLTMRLDILPSMRRKFLTTEIAECAGLIPANQPRDLTFDHAPLAETDPRICEIYNRWPQRIISIGNKVELYSQVVLPQLYKFDYIFNTPISGKFFVPPVTVHELFSGAPAEHIDHTTLIVED